MKYRMKYKPFEAFRFGIDPEPEWFLKAEQNGTVYRFQFNDGTGEVIQRCGIDAGHDDVIACPGDWVIRYQSGSMAVEKDRIFRELYEEAPAQSAGEAGTR